MARKSKEAEVLVAEDLPRVVGDVVLRPLEDVKPNTWNPNTFTPTMLASLKHGLKTDGWLKSQSLLIWGTDEKGARKDLIIDGEHRWVVAKELGFKEGPMVFLNKLSEKQAKALTIKMDAKRGTFDPTGLGELLRDIQFDVPSEAMSLELGIETADLMTYLAMPPIDGAALDFDNKESPVPGEVPSGMTSHVKMVQLFFNQTQYDEFQMLVKDLAPGFQTKDITSTTLEAMRFAGKQKSEK